MTSLLPIIHKQEKGLFRKSNLHISELSQSVGVPSLFPPGVYAVQHQARNDTKYIITIQIIRISSSLQGVQTVVLADDAVS